MPGLTQNTGDVMKAVACACVWWQIECSAISHLQFSMIKRTHDESSGDDTNLDDESDRPRLAVFVNGGDS
eukprot:1190735-Prorocentrum_minimum.AAC.1